MILNNFLDYPYTTSLSAHEVLTLNETDYLVKRKVFGSGWLISGLSISHFERSSAPNLVSCLTNYTV